MSQYNPLTPEEDRVIVQRGTERPFTGKYHDFFADGMYVCRRCNAGLYRSEDKFKSDCGWASFDAEIPGAVKGYPDADGGRTEIRCANCGGHLGHVFNGEKLTDKNVRHCVNSISLDFIPKEQLGTAIFAGGCFWGVEYLFQEAPGVLTTAVGYTGGHKDHPTYKEVCAGRTGHLEAIEVVFDRKKTTYEDLAKRFFNIHDPTQADGQGPDIGEQYKSIVFYLDETQKKTVEQLMGALKQKGFKVATELRPAARFWRAEEYHQSYYKKNKKQPYCHGMTYRF